MNNQISKKWMIGIILVVLSAAMTFANGTVEDMDNGYYGPGNSRGMNNQGMNNRGMNGNQGMMGYRGMMDPDDMQTVAVEGKFSLVEGRYPALVNNTGETYYLLIHFPVDESQIPAEGAALKLEAFPSPMAPDQLIVVSGEADGVVFDSGWGMNGSNGDYCGYGRHGGSGRQGMNGNRGMNGNSQNWGSSSPRAN